MDEAATSAPVPPPASRAAIGFILTTVTLDVLAMSIVIPVLPRLVLSFAGGHAVGAAHVLGLFGTAWAAMQFVFSPLQGALSDRFGRRPVILISNFGMGLDYLVMALAPNLAILFVGRVMSGIAAASFSTANAYIADITPPEKRAARFGLIGVAFAVGFVCGPAVGGLLGSTDPRLPFWVAGGLSLCNGAFGLFVLPESLPADRRRPFSWGRANPIGMLGLLRGRPGLLRLGLVGLLYFIGFNAIPSITVLYTITRYHWDLRTVGLMMALSGLAGGIVGAWLTGRMVKRFGEWRTLLGGLGAGVFGLAIMGLAPSGAWYLVSIPVWALQGMAGPALNSLMSRQVSGLEQGQLAGARSSLIGVAGMIGPGIYTTSFAIFMENGGIGHFPGAPMMIGAGFLAVAVGLAAAARRRLPLAALPV